MESDHPSTHGDRAPVGILAPVMPPQDSEPNGSMPRGVRELSPAELHDGTVARTLIDVREPGERGDGQIPGARNVTVARLVTDIASKVPDVATPLAVYCTRGNRSIAAAAQLMQLGYLDVVSLAGGFDAWLGAGYDAAPADVATASQRYVRQEMLAEVGVDGQHRLRESRVLIIGAGGLGCAAALYLAAAGVGTIGIVDFDVIEVSNLHRQILHSASRVGTTKTSSAAVALHDVNPDVVVVEHQMRLTIDNAGALFRQYDVVVNGSDNFPTRYAASDAAVATGTPLVDGAVFRFEGELTTILPLISPCYRCRHPVAPPRNERPNCAEIGVLGVLPGLIGVLQATEVIKLVVGIGDPMSGRVLHVDVRSMAFREFRLRRDPACVACGGEGGTVDGSLPATSRVRQAVQ